MKKNSKCCVQSCVQPATYSLKLLKPDKTSTAYILNIYTPFVNRLKRSQQLVFKRQHALPAVADQVGLRGVQNQPDRQLPAASNDPGRLEEPLQLDGRAGVVQAHTRQGLR